MELSIPYLLGKHYTIETHLQQQIHFLTLKLTKKAESQKEEKN
jgi:hypothetical protein